MVADVKCIDHPSLHAVRPSFTLEINHPSLVTSDILAQINFSFSVYFIL